MSAHAESLAPPPADVLTRRMAVLVFQAVQDHGLIMLGVIGLINVQYAIKNGVVYVIEVNPRASRTAPFVSKAIGAALPKLAAKVMTTVAHRI